MAVKKIIWSKRAKTELNETLEFYLERNGSPDYSLKIILRLESLTNTLTKNYLFHWKADIKQVNQSNPKGAFLNFLRFRA